MPRKLCGDSYEPESPHLPERFPEVRREVGSLVVVAWAAIGVVIDADPSEKLVVI